MSLSIFALSHCKKKGKTEKKLKHLKASLDEVKKTHFTQELVTFCCASKNTRARPLTFLVSETS